MVLDHFHLTRPPFDAAPDAAFYYEDAAQQELLGALQYALKVGDGIIKVTGEAGSGKSMLCSVLAARLAQAVPPVRMVRISGAAHGLGNSPPTAAPSPQDVMYAISRQLGVAPEGKRTDELMRLFGSYLSSARAAGKLAALAIEEAQSLPLETLESLRYLTNLDDGTQKLLPIMLMGSPELNNVLRQPRLRQTRERITLSFVVPPLPPELVPDLLACRMKAAGYRNGVLFEPDAARLLARNAAGDKRRLMALADKALAAAADAGALTVAINDVRLAIRGKPTLNLPQPATASDTPQPVPETLAMPEPLPVPVPAPEPEPLPLLPPVPLPAPLALPARTLAAILPTAVKSARLAPETALPAPLPSDHAVEATSAANSGHVPLTRKLAQVALADEQARLAAAARLMMGRPETPKAAKSQSGAGPSAFSPVFTMEALAEAPGTEPGVQAKTATETLDDAAPPALVQRSLPHRALAVSTVLLAVTGIATAAFLFRPAELPSPAALAPPKTVPAAAAAAPQPGMMALPPDQPAPLAATANATATATAADAAIAAADSGTGAASAPRPATAVAAMPIPSGDAPVQASGSAILPGAAHATPAAAPAPAPTAATQARHEAVPGAAPARAAPPEPANTTSKSASVPQAAHAAAAPAAAAPLHPSGLLKQSLLASKTWLRDEPENNFCIQIENVPASEAVRAEQLLANARAAIGLSDVHSHPMLINGEARIAIVYGSFVSARKALDVQAKLSERWGTRLKIRTIRGIRAAALEAEKHAQARHR